eukprot:Colp12_sorted_trinity150504_noHs@30358
MSVMEQELVKKFIVSHNGAELKVRYGGVDAPGFENLIRHLFDLPSGKIKWMDVEGFFLSVVDVLREPGNYSFTIDADPRPSALAESPEIFDSFDELCLYFNFEEDAETVDTSLLERKAEHLLTRVKRHNDSWKERGEFESLMNHSARSRSSSSQQMGQTPDTMPDDDVTEALHQLTMDSETILPKAPETTSGFSTFSNINGGKIQEDKMASSYFTSASHILPHWFLLMFSLLIELICFRAVLDNYIKKRRTENNFNRPSESSVQDLLMPFLQLLGGYFGFEVLDARLKPKLFLAREHPFGKCCGFTDVLLKWLHLAPTLIELKVYLDHGRYWYQMLAQLLGITCGIQEYAQFGEQESFGRWDPSEITKDKALSLGLLWNGSTLRRAHYTGERAANGDFVARVDERALHKEETPIALWQTLSTLSQHNKRNGQTTMEGKGSGAPSASTDGDGGSKKDSKPTKNTHADSGNYFGSTAVVSPFKTRSGRRRGNNQSEREAETGDILLNGMNAVTQKLTEEALSTLPGNPRFFPNDPDYDALYEFLYASNLEREKEIRQIIADGRAAYEERLRRSIPDVNVMPRV